MKKPVLKLPASLTRRFVFVDCGARGDAANPLLDSFVDTSYIGFEPDEAECELLVRQAREGSFYFPVAVGKNSGTASLYVTRNPSCSSLLLPNRDLFDSFTECSSFFDILDTQSVKLVTLDDHLPAHKINDIDFLELDTQGSELDILQGAENFLSQDIIGIRVEVEFQPMYQQQPLFSDIDAYLRNLGFMLFDLRRYHLRRKSCPSDIQSQEQIIWGQALYLRDYKAIDPRIGIGIQKLAKLAVTASYYGFHSYALEIIDIMLEDSLLQLDVESELISALKKYTADLAPNWMMRVTLYLDRPPLQRIFRLFGSIILRLSRAYQFVALKRVYVWKD